MIQESDMKRKFYIDKLSVNNSEISNEDLNKKLETEVKAAYLDGRELDLMIRQEDFDEVEIERK